MKKRKQKQTIEIFKARDFLFCKPDKPEYDEVKDATGVVCAYKMTNLISICNQYSFIPAIKNPANDYSHLVFGKYPVYSFLLEKVGRMVIK